MIARLPGRIPANRVTEGFASTLDILPTFARLGGAALAERSAALGVRVLRYGSDPSAGLAGTLLGWEQQGTGAIAHIQLAGEPHQRTMRLSVPGLHMALNALGALLAAVEAGAPVEEVLDALAGFEGVRRRFELVGTANGVRVFDDYAHHPTEVRAALIALREVAHRGPDGRPTGESGRSIVVFQPHLYSRTKAFARDFADALGTADHVFVLDVYAAREQPLAGISGASIAEHVTVPVRYLPDFSSVAAQVAASVRPGDVVVTMGAGDVTMLGPEIIAALNAAFGPNAETAWRLWAGNVSVTVVPDDRAVGESMYDLAMQAFRRTLDDPDQLAP